MTTFIIWAGMVIVVAGVISLGYHTLQYRRFHKATGLTYGDVLHWARSEHPDDKHSWVKFIEDEPDRFVLAVMQEPPPLRRGTPRHIFCAVDKSSGAVEEFHGGAYGTGIK